MGIYMVTKQRIWYLDVPENGGFKPQLWWLYTENHDSSVDGMGYQNFRQSQMTLPTEWMNTKAIFWDSDDKSKGFMATPQSSRTGMNRRCCRCCRWSLLMLGNWHCMLMLKLISTARPRFLKVNISQWYSAIITCSLFPSSSRLISSSFPSSCRRTHPWNGHHPWRWLPAGSLLVGETRWHRGELCLQQLGRFRGNGDFCLFL